MCLRKVNHTRCPFGVYIVGGGTFHSLDVGFWGPDLVKFYGSGVDGKPFELMQHISQVNVLVVAVPKTSEKPRRIGFELVKQHKSTK
jgi:hypothetical protein